MNAPVIPIRPESPRGKITRWRRLLDTAGEVEVVAWDELFAQFGKPRRFLGDAHAGWSAAVFDGNERAKDLVDRVTAAVLDYDGTDLIGRAVKLWGGFYGLIHASKSHTPDLHRFRVILPLSRAVSVSEWDALWLRLNEYADGRLDGQAKDASRFWYEPGTVDGSAPETRRLDGPLLDPDEWLKRPLKAEQEAPRPVPPRTAHRQPDGTVSVRERASRYVARMDPCIEHSGGDAQLFKVALTLVRGFSLSDSDALQILRSEFNPRCQPPWPDGRLRYKVESAGSAKVPDGYLLGDRPGWSPPAEYFVDPRPVSEGEEASEREPGEDDEPYGIPPDEPEAQSSTRSLAEMLAGVLERAQSGQRTPGVPTCHARIEHTLAGFRPKMITVFGARTSFGKSSYAIMVADEALRTGKRVLLISVEDSEDTYAQRFMARRARVNAYHLRANACSPTDMRRMEEQARAAEPTPFFIDAVGWTGERIAARIREECATSPVALVIIDYIQRVASGKRTQDVRTGITHVMSIIADAIKQNGAAGLVLSQLKRPESGNPNKEPDLHDLKESGDIENMAEHVVLGWVVEDGSRDEVTQERFVKIPKNKDGPVDTRAAPIPFDSATASFSCTMPRPGEDPDDQWGIGE